MFQIGLISSFKINHLICCTRRDCTIGRDIGKESADDLQRLLDVVVRESERKVCFYGKWYILKGPKIVLFIVNGDFSESGRHIHVRTKFGREPPGLVNKTARKQSVYFKEGESKLYTEGW